MNRVATASWTVSECLKNQVITVGRQTENIERHLDNKKLEPVDPYRCLGANITLDGSCKKEMLSRLATVREILCKLSNI